MMLLHSMQEELDGAKQLQRGENITQNWGERRHLHGGTRDAQPMALPLGSALNRNQGHVLAWAHLSHFCFGCFVALEVCVFNFYLFILTISPSVAQGLKEKHRRVLNMCLTVPHPSASSP